LAFVDACFIAIEILEIKIGSALETVFLNLGIRSIHFLTPFVNVTAIKLPNA
jgi:hypothetical protein